MRTGLFLLFLLYGSFVVFAQQCPPEWRQFMSADYLYEIQRGDNEQKLPEQDFLNRLLEAARTQLVHKVQMRIKDEANLNKSAVNGHSQIVYSASTHFLTDINLSFADARTMYNPRKKKGYAIVFIDKAKAREYHKNEVERVIVQADNALSVAASYVAADLKGRARAEVRAVLPEFEKAEEALCWLGLLGDSGSEFRDLMERYSKREQAVKQSIARLKYSMRIFLSCKADLFGRSYFPLSSEVRGLLSENGCHFTTDENQADYVIQVVASSREYNTVQAGGYASYFAYVDVRMAIDEMAIPERIYEDSFSIKGVHGISYTEAARQAYEAATGKVRKILSKYIKE